MHLFVDFLVFLFTLFILITVHEWGHFWVARRLGVKTLCFSIGFGKAIWSRKAKDGTKYRLAMLPFGGYVRLLDEREGTVPENEKHLAFNRKPLWVRSLIVLAGPFINVLLAFIIFIAVFCIGFEQMRPIIDEVLPNSIAAQSGLQPNTEIVSIDKTQAMSWRKALIAVIMRLGDDDTVTIVTKLLDQDKQQMHLLSLRNWQLDGLNPDPLKALGVVPYRPKMLPIIGEVKKNSPAQKAGLQKDDKILAINNQPVLDWADFVIYTHNHPGEKATLQIERNGKIKTMPATIGRKLDGLRWIGQMGIASQPVEWPKEFRVNVQYPIWYAPWPALQEMWILTKFNFVILGKLVIGKVSLKSLGGPISIFESTSLAYVQGLVAYLSFLALISLMLAWINILPIPGLDGGHLLFYVIELIRGKSLSLHAEALILRLGIIFLIVIMLQATINDLLRLAL